MPQPMRRARMSKETFPRPLRAFSLYLGLLTLSLSAFPSFPAQTPSDPTDDRSAQELVRVTVANEIAASDRATPKQMFLSRKQTPHGSETKLYVETKEAMAGLLIRENDKPVSGHRMQEEVAHLERLSSNPGELRRKQKQEHEEAEHALRIVKALPDSFLYRFDGTEPGTANLGKPGDVLIRLKFRPNPSYSPPSRVEQVLAGMQGKLLIDKEAHRIARIDAILFKEVSFGWGILGHLDKGGAFLVDLAEVSDGAWELTHMRLDFTGKVMMVKSLTIRSDETFSDFHTVPDNTTVAKGIELLKAEQARLQRAEADSTAANKNRR